MNQKVEQIKPYQAQGSKTEQVRDMFDNIAPAYDFMNHAMTLGIDRWWRRVAVRRVERHLASVNRPAILDVATGTGDFALQLHKRVKRGTVRGIDLSQGMLDVAVGKAREAGAATMVTFEQGDCLDLPYDDEVFDAVTVAFGVRNFAHLERGYSEMWRVLKPGGMVCVLELSTPQNPLVRWFYDLYTLRIIPWIGSLKSGDRDAYRYLPQSVAAVPQGDDMLALMRSAGLSHCRVSALTLGTCSIYCGVK